MRPPSAGAKRQIGSPTWLRAGWEQDRRVKGERFSRKGRLVYGGIIPPKNCPNLVGHRKSPYEFHYKGLIL